MRQDQGFEYKAAERLRVELYIQRRAEASDIVADGATVIATNAGRAAALAIRDRINAWTTAVLNGFDMEALNDNERSDLRLLRVDIIDMRTQLLEYVGTLP